uniref:Secreted protein n=1 Tax=Kalanchoe fedtschenkoi TaxID=63787 RepID=A0A7N0T4N5_KALFE
MLNFISNIKLLLCCLIQLGFIVELYKYDRQKCVIGLLLSAEQYWSKNFNNWTYDMAKWRTLVCRRCENNIYKMLATST